MERRGEEVHVNETEASGASKEGVVRWVLIVGTVLAIGLLTIIWMTGAWTQNEQESQATASGRIEAAKRDLADEGNVADDFTDIEGAPAASASASAEPAPSPNETAGN